jgi:hypothetical protein
MPPSPHPPLDAELQSRAKLVAPFDMDAGSAAFSSFFQRLLVPRRRPHVFDSPILKWKRNAGSGGPGEWGEGEGGE